MLARILSKRHGFAAEVIDPRGWTLTGVVSRQEEFHADVADYYDVVVGLHPDQALRELVAAALRRPTLVIPCCNFWSTEEKLGRTALVEAIAAHHAHAGGQVEEVELPFSGPYNRALVLEPSP